MKEPWGSSRQGLTDRFLNLTLAKRRYDQARVLAAQGQELLRIDYKNGQAEVVACEDLHNKSGRYYLVDALAMAPGQIYISPLDLNVEHKQVEVPHKPMLRVATPLVDDEGRKTSVVILNYLAEKLFDVLRAAAKGHPGKFYVLNSDGFSLMGPDPGELWGFILPENRKQSFNALHAETWLAMRDRAERQCALRRGCTSSAAPPCPGP